MIRDVHQVEDMPGAEPPLATTTATALSTAFPEALNEDIRYLINVKHLHKQFHLESGPVKILDNINFHVQEKGFAILFGPSGSGKSTLLNVLSGLEPPTEGNVQVAGQNLYDLNADQRAQFRAQIMGIVHQENYWIKSLSVLENVALPLYLTGKAKGPALAVARQSLDQVDMGKYADYLPTVLSGGQQQMVSMARALAASPMLILADEPTGNLDSKNGREIMDLLVYFQKKLNRTVVVATHNIEYLPLSDTQLYMMDGKLTEAHRGEKLPVEIIDSLKTQIDALSKMEGKS
jgi:putative ABC transport system ATP-binding protein